MVILKCTFFNYLQDADFYTMNSSMQRMHLDSDTSDAMKNQSPNKVSDKINTKLNWNENSNKIFIIEGFSKCKHHGSIESWCQS